MAVDRVVLIAGQELLIYRPYARGVTLAAAPGLTDPGRLCSIEGRFAGLGPLDTAQEDSPGSILIIDDEEVARYLTRQLFRPLYLEGRVAVMQERHVVDAEGHVPDASCVGDASAVERRAFRRAVSDQFHARTAGRIKIDDIRFDAR